MDRSVQLLGSGGVKRVVTGPWVRREWGPVRIRDSSWGPRNPSLRPSMARSRRFLPIGVIFFVRSVQLLGSGGVKRVVTGPWVRREWGPVRICDSSWDPPNPSLTPFMARSRRVLPIGAVFGTIRAVSRKWWCQTGRRGTMGPS